ncbi:MAG: hypothetical protein SFV18_01905 [Bryobacteraceae bacterium]|nr:hypothetical protein [Bryobacteraceae bacterium]
MKLSLLAVCFAALANAHFVFVVPQAGGAGAQIVMSDSLTPDLGVDIIAGTKLHLRAGDGTVTPLAFERPEKTFFWATLPGAGDRVIYGVTDFGISTRGGKPFVLVYHPKTIVGDAFDAKSRVQDAVVELVPKRCPEGFKLQLYARGKLQPDGEVLVILPNGEDKKVKTDANGETPVFTAPGRYGAWGRYFEGPAGERDGKKFDETRHYATLVFDIPARLPQATSSFGSVASDGWLYVYGGHVSPTHTYFKEAVSGRFDRMKLATGAWESLPGGPGLQGMNLVAHNGKIYRVGGMAPRNEKNKAPDNHSVADAARFDPLSNRWEELPPLPEPRSSHDAVVVGDKLIVVGGWALKGAAGEEWRNTVAVLDLAAANPKWTSVPQPFQRRALMAVAMDGKVYVIGGMNEKQKVERAVSIFDPAANSWSEGPELPEGTNLGFAPAAGLHRGRLYVSVADGALLRLNQSGNAWEKAGSSGGRVAHRLASNGRELLLLGGAAKGKNLDAIETFAPLED